MGGIAMAAGLMVAASLAAVDEKEPVYQGKPLSVWLDQLKDKDSDARIRAVNALTHLRPPAKKSLDAVLAVLTDDDEDVQIYAAMALASFGKEATPMLIDALNGKEARIRRGAAQALGIMNPVAPEAIDPLIALLNDKEPPVRQAAAAALGNIGPDAARAVTPLLPLLKDRDADVRLAAAQGLAGIGPPAIHPLIDLLKDTDAGVRAAAANALGAATFHGSKDAVDPLLGLLQDKEAAVRVGAVRALMRIEDGEERNIKVGLVKALKDADAGVRAAADEAAGYETAAGGIRRRFRRLIGAAEGSRARCPAGGLRTTFVGRGTRCGPSSAHSARTSNRASAPRRPVRWSISPGCRTKGKSSRR